jgi:hypothetical protein
MRGVNVRRQLTRLCRVGDARGQWFLEPLRGALGRAGECGHDRGLRDEGQVDQGCLASYVRNIAHDPRVRVRLRIGLRYRWVTGTATIRPDDDPLARQRSVIAGTRCAR